MSQPINTEGYRRAWMKLQVDQNIVVPWFECDKMGLGRPDSGATIGFGGKVFRLEPVENGLQVKRIK